MTVYINEIEIWAHNGTRYQTKEASRGIEARSKATLTASV